MAYLRIKQPLPQCKGLVRNHRERQAEAARKRQKEAKSLRIVGAS